MSFNKIAPFTFQHTSCEKLSLSGVPVPVQCPSHEHWNPSAPSLTPGLIRPH